ncbi:hypothetical protein AN958_02584 [Leucoagaricus sp. SymC.cos]|nr:hypothetical protein AN958_02584 [Leucoagaricus sp. SymC.cos]
MFGDGESLDLTERGPALLMLILATLFLPGAEVRPFQVVGSPCLCVDEIVLDLVTVCCPHTPSSSSRIL